MINSPLDHLTFQEVITKNWPDLERLFEAPGGPKYCWCMLWRTIPGRPEKPSNQTKKAALESYVQSGTPIGILAYLHEEPVAWCSIAPRESYRNLYGRGRPADDQENVWSLVCMFVPRRFRGQGITRRLIGAAVEQARSKGATVVEAYPVEPDSPSYRFMGLIPSFEAANFQEVGRAGSRRYIMRLTL